VVWELYAERFVPAASNLLSASAAARFANFRRRRALRRVA
jgi:hypothetical protein